MLSMKFDDSVKKQIVAVSRSRVVMRCTKHPRYNPAKGMGAVVGNCSTCCELLDAYKAILGFKEVLGKYLRATEKYETHKPRKVCRKEAS